MSCKIYDPELFQKNWYLKKKQISNNIPTLYNDKFYYYQRNYPKIYCRNDYHMFRNVRWWALKWYLLKLTAKYLLYKEMNFSNDKSKKISILQKVLIVVILIIIIGWGIHFVIHFISIIEKNSIINSLIYSQVSYFLMFLFI